MLWLNFYNTFKMSEVEDFLTAQEEQQIIEAINKAELETSGEIRVHIEKGLTENCIERAKEVFNYLKMQETKDKNGVLFYVSVHNKSFAILGDSGIDKVVPNDFWESVKNIVTSEFSKGNKVEGLVKGITEAGKKLKYYFPYHSKDTNELTNEISNS